MTAKRELFDREKLGYLIDAHAILPSSQNTHALESFIESECRRNRVEGQREASELLKSPELMEELAAIEHQRWSRWHLYAFRNWVDEKVGRWCALAVTPYLELSEQSKESDRKEVREYLQVITQALSELKDEGKSGKFYLHSNANVFDHKEIP